MKSIKNHFSEIVLSVLEKSSSDIDPRVIEETFARLQEQFDRMIYREQQEFLLNLRNKEQEIKKLSEENQRLKNQIANIHRSVTELFS